jgi:hypothetical protein
LVPRGQRGRVHSPARPGALDAAPSVATMSASKETERAPLSRLYIDHPGKAASCRRRARAVSWKSIAVASAEIFLVRTANREFDGIAVRDRSVGWPC